MSDKWSLTGEDFKKARKTAMQYARDFMRELDKEDPYENQSWFDQWVGPSHNNRLRIAFFDAHEGRCFKFIDGLNLGVQVQIMLGAPGNEHSSGTITPMSSFCKMQTFATRSGRDLVRLIAVYSIIAAAYDLCIDKHYHVGKS